MPHPHPHRRQTRTAPPRRAAAPQNGTCRARRTAPHCAAPPHRRTAPHRHTRVAAPLAWCSRVVHPSLPACLSASLPAC
eukprot:7385233-Prymnesium_polylepis.1